MPDPVTDALGTMTADVAKACDASTFSGLRASMTGQAMQALARAQARLARHEQLFPLQKEAREDGKPLDPVHQALVDDVKVWRDYMQGVNDMRFEPQACSRAGLGDGFFYIPGTDTLLRVDGYVRYGSNFTGDDAGLGVVVIPGDPFLLKYRNRVATWTGGGNVHFDTGDMMRRIGFSHTHGSKRTSAEEPGGANAVGFISGNPADPGTNFGAFGAQATGRVSLDRFTLNYASLRAFNLDDDEFGWGWPDDGMRESYKRLGWTATFDYTRLDYAGHLQRTPDPNNVYADVNHRLYSYEFLFGPSFVGKRMISDRLYVIGKGDVQGGFRISSLDTREVTCFACGGATNTVNLSDSKTSFAWKMNAEVGVGTAIMPNLTAELTAGIAWGNFAIADVRQNPSDRGTRIGSATGYDWNIKTQFVWRPAPR